jgi:adenylylsulfate kinase-like enzyme
MGAETDGVLGEGNTDTVDVLVICGAAGVGKTSTAFEVSRRLADNGLAHALVDADELDRGHPWPLPGLPVWEMARRNLASVWGNYAALGHHRLVLCGVLADLRQELRWISEAVPDAAFTVVRLTARLGVLETRVRRREIGTATDDELVRSTRQWEEIAVFDPPGTLVVDTDGLGVSDIAERVIALWPGAS